MGSGPLCGRTTAGPGHGRITRVRPQGLKARARPATARGAARRGIPISGQSVFEERWQPVARARTYELVLDRIEEQIASGRLRVGDRLPAERELAAALGVSRVAVREAMRVLAAMGLISQATGSGREAGTILVAAPAEALTRLIRMHVLVASVGSEDLVRARITLERESARLAATHAGPVDHAAMWRLLAAMEGPGVTVEEFNDADTGFHVALARASGNSLVAELTTALRNAMRPTLLGLLRGEVDFTGTADRLSREHRQILQALVAGQGELAGDLVAAHIDRFYLRPTRW